jgi:hypothetical protein
MERGLFLLLQELHCLIAEQAEFGGDVADLAHDDPSCLRGTQQIEYAMTISPG